MRVGVERGRNCGKGMKRQAGAVAAIFFIWLILVVSRMRLSSAAVKEVNGRTFPKSPSVHRKTHILETEEELFKPPVRFKVHGGGQNDDVADIVYEDDKRVVHTGPNPLHN